MLDCKLAFAQQPYCALPYIEFAKHVSKCLTLHCWSTVTIQEHLEKLLRLRHRLNPQFLLEHSLAPLILSQCLTTTALGGIGLHELPVGFLVTMVHLEDGTSPFCGVLVATIL